MNVLTTEQATKNVEAARQRLADQAASGSESSDLALGVNEVARAEGEYRVFSLYEQMKSRGMTKDEITVAVLDLLTNPTDDTWSGRGNDAKRAKNDGMKSAASTLRWAA